MRRAFGTFCSALRARPRTSLAVGFILVLTATVLGAYAWADAQFHAAERAYESDRYDRARIHLERCLFLWPRSADVHLLAARLDRNEGRYADAEAHLYEATRLQGGGSEATQLEWVLLRFQSGEVDELAFNLWNCVEQKHPQSRDILASMARTYLAESRLAAALKCLDRWLEIEPDQVRARYWRGWVLERLEAKEAARKDYGLAVEADPDYLPVRLRLAEMHLAAVDPVSARPHVERLTALAPDRPDVLYVRAHYLFQIGRADESRRLLDQALQDDPRAASPLLLRTKIEMQDGNSEEAVTWARRFVESSPFAPDAHRLLAQALTQAGRPEEAARGKARQLELQGYHEELASLARASARRMSDPDLGARMGELFLKIGQEPVALRWLYGVLQRDPAHRRARELLVAYYERQGDAKKAETHRRHLKTATH